ncbi:hypothetical protein EV2_032616 [Malus domestica]
MLLDKCYVRYSEGGYHPNGGHDDDDDDELEKTKITYLQKCQKLAINVTSGSTTVMAHKNNGEIAFLEIAKQKSNEEDKRGNHMGTLIHAGIRQDLVKEMHMRIPSLVCMSHGNPCIGKRGSSM